MAALQPNLNLMRPSLVNSSTLYSVIHQSLQDAPIVNTALVVKEPIHLAEQTETISKIALDRLNNLRAKMLKNFRQGDDTKALELLELYQIQIQQMLKTTMTSLGNRPFFTNFKHHLFKSVYELEKVKQIVEKKVEYRSTIEAQFLEQISQIEQGIPEETQAYLNEVLQELQAALETKNQALNQVSSHYLHQIGVLENFITESTQIIPSFSLYGEIEQQMWGFKKSLHALQNDIISTMLHLVNPETIKAQIQEKIKGTLAKIDNNKMLALNDLRKALTESSIEESMDLSGKLQEVNEIYLLALDGYLNLMKQSLNELVQEITKSLVIALTSEDQQIEILTNKSQSMIQYLNYESNKILEVAQISQKPIVSKDYGEKKGIPFETTSSLLDGRISKISIGAKKTIESLQVVYVDQEGNQKFSPVYGKSMEHNKKIYISLDEKIHKIVIGETPLKDAKKGSRIESISLHVHNHEGRGVHVYELTGQKSARQAIEEISFKDSYYLSAIRGHANAEGIHSLSFIFSKDFSSLLKKDLSTRIQKAIEVLRENPSCKASESAKDEIHKMFSHQVFLNLDDAKQDPYVVLEIKAESSLEEIKKAYRKFALKYHPDKTEPLMKAFYKRKFEEVKTAYESLLKKFEKSNTSSNDQKLLILPT